MLLAKCWQRLRLFFTEELDHIQRGETFFPLWLAEYSRNYVRVLLALSRAARPPPGLAPCGMELSGVRLKIFRALFAKIRPRAEMKLTAALNPDAPARPGGITRGLGPHWRPAHLCGQRSAPGAGEEFPKFNSPLSVANGSPPKCAANTSF